MQIVVDGVSKTYGGSKAEQVLALDNIELTIAENEFVVLVGPSGCGKSTLLNIVGGLLSPSAGHVYVEGLAAEREPAIGVVFQDVGLFPWRTVRENIAFGLEEAGVNKPEQTQRLQHYMKMVGLEGFENAYPHQLSGGMRQRAGIARALAIQPDLLLMDEPFSALDAQTRTLMQEELLRIWQETRVTTLYVTHNIQEAVYLADRVVVLSRRPGRIVKVFPIELPKFARDKGESLPAFNRYTETIWNLIRHDAQQALLEGEDG